MSFDLYLWHEPAPITATQALAISHRLADGDDAAQPDFALNGTDHASHREQGSMIRRYIIWRNRHAHDERLRRIIAKANAA